MSFFDRPDSVPAAHPWRCPHCKTLQAGTSRCWRCSRSAATCSTCRHYRLAVVSDLGFCVVDRAREPLSGDEIRSCWGAAADSLAAAGLFSGLEPPAPPRPAPTPIVERRSRPITRATKPPLEEVRAAAWADAPKGDLVDAPSVEPGRTLTSEVERRRLRFWRR